jgi:hypothetical protein
VVERVVEVVKWRVVEEYVTSVVSKFVSHTSQLKTNWESGLENKFIFVLHRFLTNLNESLLSKRKDS